jgi:hypothetical protein
MKYFTLKEFEDKFRAAEAVKQKITDADPNLDRSKQIRRVVDKALYVYQQTYEDLKKEETVQSTLLKYFESIFVSVSLLLGMIFRMSLFLFCFQ